MYIYMYIYTYVYICIYVYIYIHIWEYTTQTSTNWAIHAAVDEGLKLCSNEATEKDVHCKNIPS